LREISLIDEDTNVVN